MFWQLTSPSPSPPHPHTKEEQLNHSLSDPHFHLLQWESRSRTQKGDTPMHATGCSHSLPRPVAECPPLGLVQKQVQFDLTDDLDDALWLAMDLASFLGEEVIDEQIDASCPPAPLTADPPEPPHDNGNQHLSTHTEDPNQKLALPSLWLPFEPSLSIGEHPTQWSMLMIGSRHRWLGNHGTLVGGKSLKLSIETQWVTSAMPRLYNLPGSRLWLLIAKEEVSGW